MGISYNKLWHMLIEKGMNKEQLKMLLVFHPQQ